MNYRKIIYLIEGRIKFPYKKYFIGLCIFGRYRGGWLTTNLYIYRDLQNGDKKYNFLYIKKSGEEIFGNYKNIRDLSNLFKLMKKDGL